MIRVRERGQPFDIFSRNVHEFHDRLYGHGCCYCCGRAVAVKLVLIRKMKFLYLKACFHWQRFSTTQTFDGVGYNRIAKGALPTECMIWAKEMVLFKRPPYLPDPSRTFLRLRQSISSYLLIQNKVVFLWLPLMIVQYLVSTKPLNFSAWLRENVYMNQWKVITFQLEILMDANLNGIYWFTVSVPISFRNPSTIETK